MNDLVTHAGKTFRLDDLASYMEWEHREAVHFSDAAPGTAAEIWAEFVRRYPDEADHLAEITPPVHAE